MATAPRDAATARRAEAIGHDATRTASSVSLCVSRGSDDGERGERESLGMLRFAGMAEWTRESQSNRLYLIKILGLGEVRENE